MNSLALLDLLLKKKKPVEEDMVLEDDLIVPEDDVSSEDMLDDDDSPEGVWNQSKADAVLREQGPFYSKSKDDPLILGDEEEEPSVSTFRQTSPFLDLLKEHLGKAPRREDYGASTKRKILAALAGTAVGIGRPTAGYELAKDITEKPYNNARQDWADRLNPLSKAASLESSENIRGMGNYLKAVDIERKDRYGKSLIESRDKAASSMNKDREARRRNEASRAESARIQAEAARERAKRKPRSSVGSRTTAEKNIRQMAIEQALKEHPQYRRLLGQDGQTLITPKTEQDNIDFSNLIRIAKGMEAKLRQQYSEDEEE